MERHGLRIRQAILVFMVASCAVCSQVSAAGSEVGRAQAFALTVQVDSTGTSLGIADGEQFHRTAREVVNQRAIEVPGSSACVVLWDEVVDAESKATAPFYAISRDGRSMAAIRETSYVLKLRYGDFDPSVFVPRVEYSLATEDDAGMYIVQFVTQPLAEYRAAIEELGGEVHQFLANHAHFVRMDPAVRDAVADLPFVRWVGPVHAAYKLEEEIYGQLLTGAKVEPRRYSIMLYERGPVAQDRVAAHILELGAKIHGTTPQGFRIEATMTLDQVLQIAQLDDVMFIDRKGRLEVDMDIVRNIGGANYVEGVLGFTGQGVRAEVADSELDVSHTEWSQPPIIHVSGSDLDHGTSVYGILFARGAAPQARGLIPDAVGIFAYSDGLLGGGTTRYTHTAELVDPVGPYRTVFQTNSTGDPRTLYYTTISAEMDDLLFVYDLALTQSQSNAGTRDSRPQAWAKNVISGGAIEHYNTLTRDDDCWCSQASIGPAEDGRIKPDLCFFYDDTYTTTAGGGYTEFGGTSGATPSIAGHVGLFFQMWSEGIFDNEVPVPGGTVFENRSHMTTAKAVLINTANQYPFSGTSHDLTRVHQGWGMPDLRYLYDMRNDMSIIDETELLGNMESMEYSAYVAVGTPELRATLVYADPMGVVSSSQDRINDLTLKVTSPSEVVYWGNNGLLEGNWSVAGGSPNTIDTVENVFVENPEEGIWLVEVIASEVNQDGHVETPELDVDYALVTSGALLATCTSDGRIRLPRDRFACEDELAIRVVDCDLNGDDGMVETATVVVQSTTEPGGETIVLTETGPLTADFRGTVMLSVTDGVGVVQVSDGDAVTITYIDEDDGQGGVDVPVVFDGEVDCVPPTIFDVQAVNIQPRSATITFSTDEPATGAVRYGLSCGALTEEVSVAGYGMAHELSLLQLDDQTAYYYVVDAEDEAGNLQTDDNGGNCYAFVTPDVPDFFTELFSGGRDLANVRMGFSPNATVDFYAGCIEPIDELPTDPTGGSSLSFTPSADDGSAVVTLTGGATVSLYGESYNEFHVGTNGYITFGVGDSDFDETLAEHFALPRIAAWYDDLNPGSSGSVTWRQLDDRVAVTWLGVPEWNTSNSNTFQIEIFFDGTIMVSYLAMAADDGLAGLSAGAGLDPEYVATDLSEMGDCIPPDCNENGIPDDEDIAAGTSADCNVNTIPDECDISGGISQDTNGNGVPDECVEVPMPPPAPHDVKKNRYISFVPNNTEPVAFQIEMTKCTLFPDSTGVVGWVDIPDEDGMAEVADDAVFSTAWPEVVHVGGCGIVPTAQFGVRATANGALFTDSLGLGTVSKPAPKNWADCVGDYSTTWSAPNGVVNISDVMAILQAFQFAPSAPPIPWVDLDPEVPNGIVNMTDVQQAVSAFKGMAYPFSSPADCP